MSDRVIERLLEDESLTADLVDSAARRLLEWVVGQAEAILEPRSHGSAEESGQRLQALRRTARLVAELAGQSPPDLQLQIVNTLLGGLVGHWPNDLSDEGEPGDPSL